MTPYHSNSDSENCSPMSSNCIIWQGEDIACINLCKGDSISDVTYKLATEICALKTEIDLTDLDLKCLVDVCNTCPNPDKSLSNVLTLLINKVCTLSGGSTDSTTFTNLVRIADCFRVPDSNGDPVLDLESNEYLKRIGLSLCTQITNLNALNTTVSNLEHRVVLLEADSLNPQTTDLSVTTKCVQSDNSKSIAVTDAFELLETNYCNLSTALGSVTDILKATGKQCAGLSTAQSFTNNSTMAALPGWKTTTSSVADSLNNIWLTLCDLRSGLETIKSQIPSGCDLILMDYVVVLSGTADTLSAQVVLNGYANIPNSFYDCPAGSTLTIKDVAGNTYKVNINVAQLKNESQGITYSLNNTPLNTASDFTFTLESCLTNGTNTCSKTTIKSVPNSSGCPVISTNSDSTNISYSFSNTGSIGTNYNVDLLNETGSTVLSSQTLISNGSILSGSFTGLIPATNYNLRITILIGNTQSVCSLIGISTVQINCNMPINVTASLV